MAGIGFELRKMYHRDGILSKVKAFSFTAFISVGPLISCMLMIFAMHYLLDHSSVTYAEKELILASLVYAFIFSYIIANTFSLFISRFISDQLYTKQFGQILPSYYLYNNCCIGLGAFVGAIFILLHLDAWQTILPTYILFQELILIWISTVYLSAVRHYKTVVFSYLVGITVTLLSIYSCTRHFNMTEASQLLYCFAFGFFFTAFLLAFIIRRYFHIGNYQLSFRELFMRQSYTSLIGIGVLTASGLYMHQFIYWLSDYGYAVFDIYRVSDFYDLPVFYAFATIIPSMVTFIISAETSFYPKYRHYFDAIMDKGSIIQINRARDEMDRVLMQQLTLLMGIQLIISVLAIAFGIQWLPRYGLTSIQVQTFNILVLGYFLYMMFIIITLFLLYFDDKKGVLLLALFFFISVITLTLLMIPYNNHGLSFFVASLVTFIAAYYRLRHMVKHIHYYTFCRQPVIHKAKQNIV